MTPRQKWKQAYGKARTLKWLDDNLWSDPKWFDTLEGKAACCLEARSRPNIMMLKPAERLSCYP